MAEFSGLKALIVDDQEMFREAMADELASLGFEVKTAVDGEDGFKQACKVDFDIILSDIKMPNWDGIRFLDELKKARRHIKPFVFITGFAEITVADAMDRGADAFLGKPFSADSVANSIRRILLTQSERWHAAGDSVPKASAVFTYKNREDFIAKEDLSFGRNGFCALLDETYVFLRPSDSLSFEIRFQDDGDNVFRGKGWVVWKKAMAPSDRLLLGVEIESVEPNCIQDFVQFVESFPSTAAIPNSTARV